MKSFAHLVNDRMTEKGVSLRKVAQEVGLDPSFFSKVLTGKRSPPQDQKLLRKLAKILEVDPLLLVISTGAIPMELQSIMEDPNFLRSLRQIFPSDIKEKSNFSAAPSEVRERKAPVLKEKALPQILLRSSDMPEDLL